MTWRYRVELTEQPDGRWWWKAIKFKGTRFDPSHCESVALNGNISVDLAQALADAAGEIAVDRRRKS